MNNPARALRQGTGWKYRKDTADSHTVNRYHSQRSAMLRPLLTIAVLLPALACGSDSTTHSVSQAAGIVDAGADVDLCTLPDYGAPQCHTVTKYEPYPGCGAPVPGALICCCP